jgi:D-alanine-D-alanine ligase
MNFMNIVVLCAGTSTEREVSIVTGSQVCKALRERGHNARLLDVFFGSALSKDIFFDGTYDLEGEIAILQEHTALVADELQKRTAFLGENVVDICATGDVVFMALHGSNGEDGRLQAMFDLMGIRYTGAGYLGSALAMDKGLTKQMFLENHIPTPDGIRIHSSQSANALSLLKQAEIGFPCVVKPCCGGSSIGVSIPQDEVAFEQAIADAFSMEHEIVVEKYIKGREFSIGVVGETPYPIIEIAPVEGFYNYENKYSAGKTNEYCPAPLSQELTEKLQKCALDAYHVLRLERYARIDFLMDEEENIYCIEANTLPGMTPTSLLPQEAAVLGYSFGELCELLIEQ